MTYHHQLKSLIFSTISTYRGQINQQAEFTNFFAMSFKHMYTNQEFNFY